MLKLKKKQPAKIARSRENVTLGNANEQEFSLVCHCARVIGVEIRDMGSGYSIVRNGSRVGFLSLDTSLAEALHWVEWACTIPDFPTEDRFNT